jgi:DNA excision repair protein ERCC-2
MGFENSKPTPEIVYQANKEAPYMPYAPREGQLDIIADIRSALDEHRHIVIESGTGTGKTIVALAAGLEHAKRTGKKIIYLTRTISQSDQIMKELKAISTIQDVSGITLTGRNKACPLFRGEEYDNLPPNVLSLMCEDKKSKSVRNSAGGCRYYDRTKQMLDGIKDYCKHNFPTSDELDRYCVQLGVCPYETRKALMKEFDVIVAPYIHILSEDIRSNFLNNLGGENIPLLLIVDEAHNLIDAARQQESYTISLHMVEAAIDECDAFKRPELYEGVVLDDFINYVRVLIRMLATQYITLGKKEFKLPDGAVEDGLCKKFELRPADLDMAIRKTIMLGEDRMDVLLEKGGQSMSPVYTLGVALQNWVSSGGERYVKSIKAREDGEYLSAACIDPADIVKFMQEQDGAVHMSGTLQPLEQYYKIMGLPRTTRARTYPSPFPPENKRVVYVDDLTTKYDVMSKDPAMTTKIERRIASLCNAVTKNTLVFFPSYKLLNSMRPFLERDIDRALYWEEPGRQNKTMRSLDIFRKGQNGVFFCVMGGSVAEGIDFPGDELCFAILVGIQFPPPSLESDAMKDLFDKRYGPGMGWKYLQETPAIRKMRQAIGRLIRTETDRGMAVILDSRASRYKRQLDAELTDDAVRDVVQFFNNQ